MKILLIIQVLALIALGIYTFILYERVSLLKEIKITQEQLITEKSHTILTIKHTNSICYTSMIDIMQRLGLDKDTNPLFTTALWHSMGNMRVSEARHMLKSPPAPKYNARGAKLEDFMFMGGGIEKTK